MVGGTLANILKPPDRGEAGECRGDEPRLALVVLPHRGGKRAFGSIGEDIDLLMLIALADNPSLVLFNLRWQPRDVEMLERFEPELGIDAGAYRLRRAYQETNLAGAGTAEQPVEGLRLHHLSPIEYRKSLGLNVKISPTFNPPPEGQLAAVFDNPVAAAITSPLP